MFYLQVKVHGSTMDFNSEQTDSTQASVTLSTSIQYMTSLQPGAVREELSIWLTHAHNHSKGHTWLE